MQKYTLILMIPFILSISILSSFLTQAESKKSISSCLNDTCVIYERDIFLAVEVCVYNKSYDVWTFCRNNTDTFSPDRAIEFDTICWNVTKSYNSGIFIWMGDLPERCLADSINRIRKENTKKIQSLFYDDNNNNIVTVYSQRYKRLHDRWIHNYDYIGHMYRVYKVKIQYVVKGKYDFKIPNFCPASFERNLEINISAPCYTIINVLEFEPLIPKINEECLFKE